MQSNHPTEPANEILVSRITKSWTLIEGVDRVTGAIYEHGPSGIQWRYIRYIPSGVGYGGHLLHRVQD